jgi:hypothetical protein
LVNQPSFFDNNYLQIFLERRESVLERKLLSKVQSHPSWMVLFNL